MRSISSGKPPGDPSPLSRSRIFSVIIPAYNEEKYLPATLAAAHRALLELRSQERIITELIVVDNHSADRTADIAREAGAKVVYEEHNQIAKARNTGARQATGDFLVFIDADTLVHPQLILNTWKAMARDGAVGGGSLIEMDKKLDGVEGAGLRLWNAISTTFRLAAGSYLFCRRDAFQTVGGFDESLYVAEELFLSKALKKLGKEQGRPFVILADHPPMTSARKLEHYGKWETLKVFCRFMWLPTRQFRKREACGYWYEGRR